MRPACFAEPAHQNAVGSFQKPEGHFERWVFLQLLVYSGKLAEGLSFSDIDDHGGLGAFVLGFQNQLVEFREQADRQVIDAEESPILEGSKESSLSRAAQAGDDDERGWLHGRIGGGENSGTVSNF